MTSGGRELLKWLAVVLMTGDHVVKVLDIGYVPGISEAGRIAFPLFAMVMAYNLAQPGSDARKSTFRLFLWGLAATPVAALAFGELFPLNVLITFACAAGCAWAVQRRQWVVLALLAVGVASFVDYAWCGVWLVLAGWHWYRGQGGRPWMVWACMGLLCVYNGNGWALLAIPLMRLGEWQLSVPRTRWAFYGYYVGHLALLAGVASYQSHGRDLPSWVNDSSPDSVLMISTPPLQRALSGRGIPICSAGTSRMIVIGSGVSQGVERSFRS